MLVGWIPIICVEIRDEGVLITVTAHTPTTAVDYIAVSLVWVDGLGGQTETGLNRYQVKRLADLCFLLGQSAGNTSFCVGLLVHSTCQRSCLHQSSCRHQAHVHEGRTCLDFDKNIELCSILDSSEYLYARIYLSVWMQRMWTYEEAVLAKELVFLLKDRFHVYNIKTLPEMRKTVSVVFQCLATQLYRL